LDTLARWEQLWFARQVTFATRPHGMHLNLVPPVLMLRLVGRLIAMSVTQEELAIVLSLT
jgi:hypothetical protein